ncbi:MAG: Gfo/Idh/MocA family oxidoreductase [Eubacterium sp.]|nr:Gfo/Idh/MocA family oxidoreductase [Eubacterium sp.]
MKQAKVVLVGLGPHAKQIYMKCFEVNHMQPAFIIDLDSKKQEVIKFLEEKNMQAELYFVKEKERNATILSDKTQKEILERIRKLDITHAIISTEPKVHYAYICFCLKNNIHVLVDKPLTAPIQVSTDINMAQRIQKEYLEIRELYMNAKKQRTILQVQCQRRWHKGYQLVHKIASDIVEKYEIPITAIQLSHCDGMWNMPDEFVFRENHPYKYGYGKLFHSGYHFVDLAAWFEQINNKLQDKIPNEVELFATSVRPSDFMCMINKKDYNQLFKDNKFDHIFDQYQDYEFEKYGEIDLYSIMQFKHQERVISTVTLNLMQNGFSRRSWNKIPEDTYKANGRVRHEYMNIEIGPLMNIQIHSYQSKEIKDRIKTKTGIGEVEHFDIFVFRNVDIIGGKPMEKYTLEDLYGTEEIIQGYNEDARQQCFFEFIHCNVKGDPIFEHELGIQILAKEYESLCNRAVNKSATVCFPINMGGTINE